MSRLKNFQPSYSDIPGMIPVTLRELEQKGLARINDDSREIEFIISPKWPYRNESRIGDASISRLFECIREMHWERDIITITGETPIDCTTIASFEEFKRPVTAGEKVIGRYKVLYVGNTSYRLELSLTSPSGSQLCSSEKTFAFFDSIHQKAISPPDAVRRNLEILRVRDTKVPQCQDQ